MVNYIDEALAEYGASYDYAAKCIVRKDGRATSISIEEKGNRVRMVMPNGAVQMSGPKSKSTICSFVERYWYWVKI